jgi:hypothetical protein
LDVAGAAYLRDLWKEHHAELSDPVRPQAALLHLPTANAHRPDPASLRCRSIWFLNDRRLTTMA